jgi:hypothetical protein
MSRVPPLLEVDDLVVHFPAPGGGPLGLSRRSVKALNGVSLTLAPAKPWASSGNRAAARARSAGRSWGSAP